jgi:hypothetical protein
MTTGRGRRAGRLWVGYGLSRQFSKLKLWDISVEEVALQEA